MNKSKNALSTALAAILLAASLFAVAAPQPSNAAVASTSPSSSKMLLYISPQEYNNSVLLRTRYYQYWFEQGPKVEALARKKFGAEFGEVAMCEGTNEANTIVWLKPSMFYNPVARSYFGRIVAEVYSGNGKSLATYTGKVQHPGSIDINTVREINTTYNIALNDVVRQMAADQNFKKVLDIPPDSAQIPCANIALYSPKKSISFY